MQMQDSKGHLASDSVEVAIHRLKSVNMVPKDQEQHLPLPRASVLVPLFLKSSQESNDNDNSTNGQLHLLLTKRPDSMRSHSGDVCFPGGKQDPDDLNDDVKTALRETKEEVGIDASNIVPLCRLKTLESYTGLCVTPVVALLISEEILDLSRLNLSESEVEAAFSVPLDYFLDETNLSSKHEIEWRGGTFEMRTYEYASECGRTFRIWGLTAHIAHQVATIALNCI
jgi:peroxisomal coenzyme A diphosphatase NUDT7